MQKWAFPAKKYQPQLPFVATWQRLLGTAQPKNAKHDMTGEPVHLPHQSNKGT